METLRQCRSFAQEYLRKRQIADADSDAWLLLEHVFSLDKNGYFMHADEGADPTLVPVFKRLVEKRGEHYPLQYITGEAWFYGRRFAVDERVLIPRQDTEVLLEEALRVLHGRPRILDLCTGSGCILLTLLLEGGGEGVGTDCSADALCVARNNARALGVSDVSFIHGDLFASAAGPFDLIVSNPPYIESAVVDTLMEEVRLYEPRLALDGDTDGLHFYRRIVSGARDYLRDGGWLFFEIGYNQAEALKALFAEAGYTDIRIVKDLSGNDRVAFAKIRRSF